jgi:predicted RNA binding protein YcfA (HicA-like mRNA interferase family)
MTRLPALRARQVIAALERAGFVTVRVRGSHYQMLAPKSGRRVTVPHHGGDLTRGTLSAIISQAGMTVDEFLRLL